MQTFQTQPIYLYSVMSTSLRNDIEKLSRFIETLHHTNFIDVLITEVKNHKFYCLICWPHFYDFIYLFIFPVVADPSVLFPYFFYYGQLKSGANFKCYMDL